MTHSALLPCVVGSRQMEYDMLFWSSDCIFSTPKHETTSKRIAFEYTLWLGSEWTIILTTWSLCLHLYAFSLKFAAHNKKIVVFGTMYFNSNSVNTIRFCWAHNFGFELGACFLVGKCWQIIIVSQSLIRIVCVINLMLIQIRRPVLNQSRVPWPNHLGTQTVRHQISLCQKRESSQQKN